MKRNVLVSARVVADVSSGVIRWSRDIESEAKQLESLASEFNDFVRDHRSMDWVTLYVEREYENQCSHCYSTWEVDENGVPMCCQEAITEHESEKAK